MAPDASSPLGNASAAVEGKAPTTSTSTSADPKTAVESLACKLGGAPAEAPLVEGSTEWVRRKRERPHCHTKGHSHGAHNKKSLKQRATPQPPYQRYCGYVRLQLTRLSPTYNRAVAKCRRLPLRAPCAPNCPRAPCAPLTLNTPHKITPPQNNKQTAPARPRHLNRR
jgi:hypothetical protein